MVLYQIHQNFLLPCLEEVRAVQNIAHEIKREQFSNDINEEKR